MKRAPKLLRPINGRPLWDESNRPLARYLVVAFSALVLALALLAVAIFAPVENMPWVMAAGAGFLFGCYVGRTAERGDRHAERRLQEAGRDRR